MKKICPYLYFGPGMATLSAKEEDSQFVLE